MYPEIFLGHSESHNYILKTFYNYIHNYILKTVTAVAT